MKNIPKLIQGPLAGYSCAPFRVITTQWGQPDFCCTEMISVKTLLHKQGPQHRFTDKDPEEGPLCYQLSSTIVEELGKAVKLVESFGADFIDLNCGCPVAKIRSKGAGSKLLENPKQLAALIAAMRQATEKPISIKIRIDLNDHEINRNIAKLAEDNGVDFIIVHGRNWRERYDTPCRLEHIAEIVQAVKIPVIGNGDVKCAASYQNMLDKTGCAGVMISRASVGKPWLFQQIRAELAGEIFTPPPLNKIGDIFLEHVERLIKLECERVAILQCRKLGKYYASGIEHRKVFQDGLNCCESFEELQKLVERCFGGETCGLP